MSKKSLKADREKFEGIAHSLPLQTHEAGEKVKTPKKTNETEVD
jgi:hypothetical protein